ncbi:hypothetical protein AAVH_16081 [Aphelenchoides avenae]|nr:hypothetical protein AAVH_16081 [Aphelenchus avenae]
MNFQAYEQDEHREEALRILERNGWKFGNVSAPFPSAAVAAKARIHNANYLVTSAIVYTVIIRCQYGVLVYLRRLGAPSHSHTCKAHAEVNRALVALAITPLFTILPTAVCVASNELEVNLGNVYAYLSLGLSAITIANPVTAIYFVRAYRERFLRLIGVRKKHDAIAPTANLSVASSSFDPATRCRAQPVSTCISEC